MSPLFVLNSSTNTSSMSCRFFSFPASSTYFKPLFSNDCMILRSIFSNWGQLKHSLMLQKETRCIKNFWTGWRCPNLIFVENTRPTHTHTFSTALQKQQKIHECFSEDKLSIIYLEYKIHRPKRFSQKPETMNTNTTLCHFKDVLTATSLFLSIIGYNKYNIKLLSKTK